MSLGDVLRRKPRTGTSRPAQLHGNAPSNREKPRADPRPGWRGRVCSWSWRVSSMRLVGRCRWGGLLHEPNFGGTRVPSASEAVGSVPRGCRCRPGSFQAETEIHSAHLQCSSSRRQRRWQLAQGRTGAFYCGAGIKLLISRQQFCCSENSQRSRLCFRNETRRLAIFS